MQLKSSGQVRMLEPLILLITHLYADNFQIFLFCPDLLYTPITDFFQFMELLYLDVLPSPKLKHGKKWRGDSWFPLSHLFCFLCILIARQRLWASLAHSHSLTIPDCSQVLWIPTQCY